MYEYKTVQAPDLASAKNLNELGQDRWRLVTIIQNQGMFYYYLIRDKVN